MKRFLIAISVFGLSLMASAQGALDRDHPRVSELQDKMTGYARDYLSTRLPDIPYIVTVRIEPLRRAVGSRYEPEGEKLPYFDLADEEIRDEWDDPSASLYVLQSRIQKATVVLSLPKALKEAEVQEIKDAITTLLRLIPGRDEIRIEQRSWSLGPDFWNYTILGVVLMSLMLIGLLFVSRTWAKRLANAIHDIKPKEHDKNEIVGSPVNTTGLTSPELHRKSSSGDFKFRDPIKTREFVLTRIQDLLKNPDFPNLQAMMEMDRVAEQSPRDLGALLLEFPLDKQKEIFSLSYKPTWLSAFTEPGELSSESLELLDRLCRIQYGANSKELEQVLIQYWRLGEHRVKFVKSLTKDEAFAVLKHLPTSISVPAARQAFPGAWAALLDSKFEPAALPAGRIKEIYWYGLELQPLVDFAALERYRQEKDLLDYLQLSTIPEERDIYGAVSNESFLWKVRPPFYEVLEQREDHIKMLLTRVPIDDWSLALFNVSRDFRKPVENLFNSKQKFLFLNKMKTIDQSGVDRRLVGRARERIARILVDLRGEGFLTASQEKPYVETTDEVTAPDENRNDAA